MLQLFLITMKTFLLTTSKTLGWLIFTILAAAYISVSAQSAGMREITGKAQTNKSAPAECLTAFRQFFAYVQKDEPSIATDQAAQSRWLTGKMRQAFAAHVKRSGGKPGERPNLPSNQDFIGVWNNPTTYTIVGSRHYDFRNAANKNDNRAIIDVLYEWDARSGGATNQYPGEKQFYSFVFVFEDKAWKLDDVYTYDDEYTSAESLRQRFGRQE